MNQRTEEELVRQQLLNRRRLPKIQKAESKTRAAMFRESLRINQLMSSEQERERLRQVGLMIDR